MGWQFRKAFQILPGVRLNLSRRGISSTLGSSPFSINVGKRGVSRTISIPGTGLYHRAPLLSSDRSSAPDQQPSRSSWRLGCWTLLIGFFGFGFLVNQIAKDKRPQLYAKSGVNCRQEASLGSPVVETVSQGERVRLIQAKGKFSTVETTAGHTCHIVSYLLSEQRVFPKIEPRSATSKTKSSRTFCPCQLPMNCTGPRGGTFCTTPSGNKRYR